MSRRAIATIHMEALQHNLQQARAAVPQETQIVAVIKANGYGHGLVTVARALHQADLYAVGCLDEAAELRQAHIEKPTLLLEGFEGEAELQAVAQLNLQTVIHSEQQWQLLDSVRLERPIVVWLKVDSGMNRLGFTPEHADEILLRLQGHPSVKAVVLISHFANADRPEHSLNQQQMERFSGCCHGDLPRSFCNSAALLSNGDAHYQFVRPGIMLYGSSPFTAQSAEALDLHPVMTLQASLIAVKTVQAGECVGYGSSWCAAHDTRLGVVAIGYGHGYPRTMPEGTPVLVRGERVPLVGRVSMDMLTVDLTDQPEVEVGELVTLWGNGLSIDEIAAQAGTISYELLCQMTSRVERVEG